MDMFIRALYANPERLTLAADVFLLAVMAITSL